MESLTFYYGQQNRIRIGLKIVADSDAGQLPAILETAQAKGMRVLDVSASLLKDEAAVEQLETALEESGLIVTSLHFELPITPAEDYRRAQEEIDSVRRLAERLDCQQITTRVAEPEAEMPQADAWKILADRGRTCARLFGEDGRRFAITNDPSSFLPTLERLERAIERIDHIDCFVHFDPGGLYAVGSEPLEAFQKFPELIVSGELRDALYRRHRKETLAAGSGEVDYESIFREILRRGYSLDLYVSGWADLESLLQSLCYIENAMGAVRQRVVKHPAS